MVRHPLTIRDEHFRHERIESPASSRPVTIDDDDCFRSRRLRSADGGIYFFRIKPPPFLIPRASAADLVPNDNPADSFHVGHDLNFHLLSFEFTAVTTDT